MNDVTDVFNSVYDATFRELMRYCLCKAPLEDAHDLLQNTYAQFYRALLKKGVHAIRDPKAYLFAALKHEIAAFYRFRARQRTVPLEAIEDAADEISVEDLSLDGAAVDALMQRIHRNYRFIISCNLGLILLGAAGILPPATTALLHNASTLAIGLKSMTDLK
jgi:DNA-directed RNA polymerase specialized sigma24 family protein